MMVAVNHEGLFVRVVFIMKQKQEHKINMMDCVSKTIGSDVEQPLE